MGLYKNASGVLTPIAGRGRAEYGASTIRTGTLTTATIAGGDYEMDQITFDQPMPDTDYLVEVTSTGTDGGNSALLNFTISDKTVNGFKLGINNAWNQARPIPVKWTAYKLYTDQEYDNFLSLMRPDLWPNNTEINFGNGLYGQRFAATKTRSELSNGVILVNGVTNSTARVINKGGMFDTSGTSGSNWYNIDGVWASSNSPAFNPLFVIYNNQIRFYCTSQASSSVTSFQYDIWITYRKK